MLHLRETLTMPNNYYTDITDSASSSIKESMNAKITEYNASRGKSKMLETLSTRQVTKALREAKIEDAIVQKVVNKLKEGGVDVNKQRIYRVPVARINPPGTVNGNHRRYPAKLWENVMNNQEDAWKGLCGLADHPTDDADPGSFKNSSIVWLGMDIDKENNLVYGIGTFVGPYGHLAQEIIDAGGRVGFSSSGFGELEADGETVNPDTYQIERLADVVLNPSQSVYGVINNETNLGNIEYTKKTVVNESVETPTENRIQENTHMDAENGVKSALQKAEEKELRRLVNKYLKENLEIINPCKQLEDLQTIMGYIKEGQLTDLEADVETRLAEAQKKIEEAVERDTNAKLQETTVTVTEDAPQTEITVQSNGDTVVKVDEEPVEEPAPSPVADDAVVAPEEIPETTTADTEVIPENSDANITVGDPVDTVIDTAADEAGEDDLFESKLTADQEKALREYVENFLNADHSKENPLKVIEETNKVFDLVKESHLDDLFESTQTRIADLQKKLNEDIEEAHKMKMDLQASSVSEVNESAKSIMKSGKLLVEQVQDYKELCSAIMKRNQQIMNEHNALKAKLELAEATNESNDITKNSTIVSLSEQVKQLKENFDDLDEKAGAKVLEMQEALAKANKELETYKEGNAKLEKANGILKTQLKEAEDKLDKAADEILDLKESVKVAGEKKAKLNESMVAGSINVAEYAAMKEENDALKAALATFKEKEAQPVKLDMAQLDEAAQHEIRILKREVNTLKGRLGESVENYVKSMEGNVVSYYNDLEARYGEAIKPYKSSFLKARSLREAQRMFMAVARELESQGQLDESVEYVPTEGKTSDFYTGNVTENPIDSVAASMGLY
jgi:archaellum component FlaF (FlaF/FlaG flagellin family)